MLVNNGRVYICKTWLKICSYPQMRFKHGFYTKRSILIENQIIFTHFIGQVPLLILLLVTVNKDAIFVTFYNILHINLTCQNIMSGI